MLVFNLLEPEEEKSRLEYYLHTIHQNVQSQVVVMLIGTHADDKRCTSSYKKKLFQGMAQDWNEKYPYLKHMTAIDAKSGKGISEQRDRLVGYITTYNWLPQQMPRGYLSLEVCVSSKAYSSIRPILSMAAFEQLVVKSRCDKKGMVPMAKFLADLGSIVYSNPWIVLDPAALSEAFGEVPFSLRRQNVVTLMTEPANELEARKQVESLLSETEEMLGEYELILAVLQKERARGTKSSSSSADKKHRKSRGTHGAKKQRETRKSQPARKLSSDGAAAIHRRTVGGKTGNN